MSKIFKKEYTAFNRNILTEFMSDKELKEMDRMYNNAKIKRIIKKYKKEIMHEKNN
jgi:hypothetical protein